MRKYYIIFILFTLKSLFGQDPIGPNLYGNESKMVLIPVGKLNANVLPRYIHLKEYYIDKTEVTQEE